MDLGKAFAGDRRVNRSLPKIYQEQAEIWSGNVVAYNFSDETSVRREHLERIVGPTVTGAFIPCAAEETLGCCTFEILPAAAAQCSAQSELASPIMTRIGIPFVIRRLPLETRWRDRK
ncbi:hypothetical protein E8E11_007517 [Didymella keratinophila]|nr:hypothetical protein E8E11_007517 [Didymella keratinophila]